MIVVREQSITDATLSNFCFGLGNESRKLIQIIVNVSYSSVHFRMSGLDSCQKHMSLN